jgi:hypothetical protein
MEDEAKYIRDEGGKFVPGIGGGRPKGRKNKFSRLLKERVEEMLEKWDEFLENDLEKMRPGERMRLWFDMQEYIRPKQQRVSMDIEPGDKAITKIVFEVKEAKRDGEGG